MKSIQILFLYTSSFMGHCGYGAFYELWKKSCILLFNKQEKDFEKEAKKATKAWNENWSSGLAVNNILPNNDT